jgi:hypothetical protein
MKRIHDSLRTVLQRHRLVFWYDATREWEKGTEIFVDAEGEISGSISSPPALT